LEHDPDLIVFDEGHHAVAGTWEKITKRHPRAHLLGVTATPCRADGKGLGGVYDALIQGPSMQELIDEGYLVPPEVWAPGTVDLTGVRTRFGDFKRDELNAAMDKREITGDAVEHYARHCDRVPAICFCVSVAHAEHVAEQFRAAGYAADSVDGKLDQATRDKRIAALGNGGLHVLTSCDLISEGVDIPVVGAAILLRPTKSLGLYMQQVGRALRPAPGKTKAIVLDHVGNVERHGFPQMPRAWSLENGTEEPDVAAEAAKGVRVCHECHHAHEYAPACPLCGFEYPAEQVEPPKQVAGELQRLDMEEFVRLKYEAGSLKDMHTLAKELGYKSGWAWGEMKRRRRGMYPKPAKGQMQKELAL
jgi:superfamily II DNA or RNA helicase